MLLMVKRNKIRILINIRMYSAEGCADLFCSHNLDILKWSCRYDVLICDYFVFKISAVIE